MLLGEWEGYLQVVNLTNLPITSTHKFNEGGDINDMLAIDDTNFLLATAQGLLRTTRDQVVKHYYKAKTARAVCHIVDSIYLVGYEN